MKAPLKNPPAPTFIKVGVWIAISSAIVLAIILSRRHPGPEAKNEPRPLPTSAPAPAAAPTTPMVATAGIAQTANSTGFQERPFPVAYQSLGIQWTLADGMNTNVIKQLAHNAQEYQRMVAENPKIVRRQLVYLKETAASVFEAAKLTRTPVKQLTLPGADGQEMQFEIVKSEGDGSSRQGMFYGHLVGNPDSQVSLAFMDGREAYTVLSPTNNIYIVGEPREPGQVIVKLLDPNTYFEGPPEAANDFIKTDSTLK